MVKTTQVAADRAHDQTKTVLPAEVAQGVYIKHAPSLQALKLMHLMIAKAGGRMADDVRHEMRLSDLKKINGMRNHTRQTVVPLFEELSAAVLTINDAEKMTTTVGGLLDQATIDYRHEVSGNVLISWTFRTTFKEMARDSNHWAILDRQAVFHPIQSFALTAGHVLLERRPSRPPPLRRLALIASLQRKSPARKDPALSWIA